VRMTIKCRSSGIITVSCGVEIPTGENQIHLFDYPIGVVKKAVLELVDQFGVTAGSIPIEYSFVTRPIEFFSKPYDEFDLKTASAVKNISFGRVSLDAGDSKSFILYNSNKFVLPVKLEVVGETATQFKLSQSDFILPPSSHTTLSIEFSPLELENYPNGPPKNQYHEGVLKILPALTFVPEIEIPITGTLADVRFSAIILDICWTSCSH
jgi:hypothetical protein